MAHIFDTATLLCSLLTSFVQELYSPKYLAENKSISAACADRNHIVVTQTCTYKKYYLASQKP